jgi:hypothetical protein
VAKTVGRNATWSLPPETIAAIKAERERPSEPEDEEPDAPDTFPDEWAA